MNILIIDTYGYSLDTALRMQEYEHEVRVFMPPLKNGEKNTTGDGYITKVPEWDRHINWADLIVNTSNRKYLKQLDTFREHGYPIWGPTYEATQWEFNRLEGQFVFHESGMSVVDFEEFKTFNAGIAFIRKNPGRYACKPSADIEDKALSHIGKSESGKDLIFMLEHWRDSGMDTYPYILQTFVNGIEMAVGGYFGLDGWVGPWVDSFEFKKLMNGDVGPNTGEMGSVVYYTEDSKLAETVLIPLTSRLIRMGYTGYIDVSTIIDKTGKVTPLEFTSRCGWPLEWILNTLTKGDPAQWRLDALNGKDTMKWKSDIATGVLLTQPPFPNERLVSQDDVTGYPIWGWDAVKDECHLIEVKKSLGVDDKLKPIELPVSSGCEIALITGLGNTVRESVDRAYRNVSRIEYPNNLMYRTDIGQRLNTQLDELKRLGFVGTHIKY